MRTQHGLSFIILLGMAVGLAMSAFGQTKEGQTNQPQKNVVESIKTVDGQVEITLTSSDPFIPRNEIVKLGADDQEFTLSRSPQGGSVYTLIFRMTPAGFAQLPDGADLVVYYGQKDSSKVWPFGKLDKSMLDKQGRTQHE